MGAQPPTPAETLLLLRQQLILAQVRIMELEDARDDQQSRLADLEHLLADEQTLADEKLDAANHLETVRADLQHQYEHMRHMQHVTNEALNASRVETAGVQTNLVKAQSELADARHNLAEAQKVHQGLLLQLGAAQQELERGARDLRQTLRRAEQAEQHAVQLDAELHALRATRTWRWTAWLRALGRKLRRS